MMLSFGQGQYQMTKDYLLSAVKDTEGTEHKLKRQQHLKVIGMIGLLAVCITAWFIGVQQ